MAICPRFHYHVRVFKFFVLFAVILFPIAASSQTNKTLRIGIASDLSTINPFTTNTTFSANFVELIFQSLITLDENFNLKPTLAKSWQISDDGTEWVFDLDSKATFHDEKTVTAHDVVFSFSVLNRLSDYLYKSVIDNISNVQEIDPHTVKVTLKKPDQQFKFFLHNFVIVPSHLFSQDGKPKTSDYDINPIGSGPFKITSFANKKLVLSRVHHDTSGTVDEIILTVYENERALLAKIINNEIDMVIGSDIRNHSIIESIPGLSVFQYNSNHLYGLFFNNANPLFADKEVRVALNLAVDKTRILENTVKDHGVVATSPVPPSRIFSNQELTPYSYAPQDALNLLKHAGWQLGDDLILKNADGVEFSFEITIPNGDDLAERTAHFIQNDLEQIGIIVELKKMDMSTLVGDVYERHNFSATLLLYNHIYPILSDYIFWVNGNNFAAYTNHEVSEELLEARFTSSEDQSRLAYFDFQQTIHDDPPAVFLFWKKSPILVGSLVTGLNPSPYLFFKNMGNVKINSLALTAKEAEDKILSNTRPKNDTTTHFGLYLSQIRKLIGLQTY